MKSKYAVHPTTIIVSLILACLWKPARAEVSFDLPFRADNPAWLEYYARNKATHGGTVQAHGFDLLAGRFNSQLGGWSMIIVPWNDHDQDPRNEHHVIFGQPVYAMEAGTIVGGWRNAPENPQAAQSDEGFGNKEESFLHPSLLGGHMPGGGNILWVDRADGTRALGSSADEGGDILLRGNG